MTAKSERGEQTSIPLYFKRVVDVRGDGFEASVDLLLRVLLVDERAANGKFTVYSVDSGNVVSGETEQEALANFALHFDEAVQLTASENTAETFEADLNALLFTPPDDEREWLDAREAQRRLGKRL